MSKDYLGDSVYCEDVGGQIKLTTENGLHSDPSNTIILEVEVLEALIKWCVRHGFIPVLK